MVEAKTVDKKISVSEKQTKKVIRKELVSAKKQVKKEKAKNVKQDADIEMLKNELAKLKKKKVKSGHVSEYNFFIRKQIKSGLTFTQAAKQWSKYKRLQLMDKRRPSAYNQFIGSQMRLGKTWTQAVALWKLAKAGKLGKKGSTRTVTNTVYKTRTIKSKPTIKYRTRTITSKPKIKYRTRTITSKPKIKYRTRTNTIIKTRTIKSKPVKRARTVRRIVSSSQGFDVNSLREIIRSTQSSSISKTDLREAMNPDSEEIAFKIVQTYFIEVARLGFKRQLTLDEIINAYFYALARVKRQNVEMSEVADAVRESGMKK
ncbi:MAG: hypothetical protein WC821_03055 [archaeon]